MFSAFVALSAHPSNYVSPKNRDLLQGCAFISKNFSAFCSFSSEFPPGGRIPNHFFSDSIFFGVPRGLLADLFFSRASSLSSFFFFFDEFHEFCHSDSSRVPILGHSPDLLSSSFSLFLSGTGCSDPSPHASLNSLHFFLLSLFFDELVYWPSSCRVAPPRGPGLHVLAGSPQISRSGTFPGSLLRFV